MLPGTDGFETWRRLRADGDPASPIRPAPAGRGTPRQLKRDRRNSDAQQAQDPPHDQEQSKSGDDQHRE
jgi:hypothetical protein